ncbi:MAG: proline racemase family protein [Acidobacteria bacterium]|nr:proline racemase family protein [Acidobacteriota bacterium]
MKEWMPPGDIRVVRTVDAHTAGEPLRIIVEGIPEIPGATILEKRRFAKKNLDWIRTALMWEPRGHADMYGCYLTEAEKPDGTLGVIFLHNDGYSTMCGHGIIALATALVETGRIEPDGGTAQINFDTPAGRVTARVESVEGRAERVSFENVPSFVYVLDRSFDIPGVGRILVDVAYGGAFYVFCRAEDFGFRLVAEEFNKLIAAGKAVKKAVSSALDIRHPENPDLGFLYGTIFIGPPHDSGNHSRNVCVFAEGEVDRSPTGTGISARAAIHHARGELSLGSYFSVESILGTCLTGRAVRTAQVGSFSAVVPEVSGTAYLTGRHEFFLNPDDPLHQGFLFR